MALWPTVAETKQDLQAPILAAFYDMFSGIVSHHATIGQVHASNK